MSSYLSVKLNADQSAGLSVPGLRGSLSSHLLE